ncbi:penicillin acylase family protein [Ferruginibacter sp.]|uniref:penicillin acylase family protein n=1 Tax=Ferruginibacter sp. TaxID=1940288 RepID=UPI0026590472|nr:penicillin acylase family protein [Ferruginibacter sp.]
MKILPFIISSSVTVGLVLVLNTSLKINGVSAPPFGKFLSPQHGLWQNAENANADFSKSFSFPQLKGKVNVYLDDRLVPHVFAEQENDVYFAQGYLHAKFRLWQMELQTHAAAGRASEIIGEKALNHDREFRRLGMGYAAEVSLKEMEVDPVTKVSCDAYTAGVNAYIHTLTEAQLPIEYKLIGYQPEPWTNLKTALFLKYMSYDLAAHEDDIEMTNAKSYFSPADFNLLYPLKQDSLDPVIPKGTVYAAPKVIVKAPATADSIYFQNKDLLVMQEEKPDPENGSNNWVAAGSKTKSGAPILCNDPHLGLNLPSLWFEMQLSTPAFNVYGATFPGAPSVIIGFNDNVAWGVTNGGRDVRDYYEIKFKDDSRQEYWFDSAWKKTEFRIETIKIKNQPDYVDTVAYTVFGPVMYDKTFSGNRVTNNKYYAVRWKANDPSKELLAFNMLNHAKNYSEYLTAISNMHTPGQNFAFAAKNGDIAMRTQGEWPAKWKGQGDFVMPGTDSSYMWQGMIPQDENPFQYNPERGFVSSANQKPADSTYPYYLGRDYPPYRGLIINRKLAAMNAITPQDMMAMQTSNYDVFAEMARPVFLKNINENKLDESEKKYLGILKNWDLNNEVNATGPTVFFLLWNSFDSVVFNDEFKKAPAVIAHPFESSLLDGILRDSSYKFLDNVETTQKETLADDVTAAFKSTVHQLKTVESDGRLPWAKYKATRINHLTKLAPFSRMDLPVGGGGHCINATKEDHGPSWRMIVSLTAETQAWGVYPGGQSGNPGSRFYDNFIDQWAAGKYYPLWMMKAGEEKDSRVKWTMSFN